jgi:hypothetical protein
MVMLKLQPHRTLLPTGADKQMYICSAAARVSNNGSALGTNRQNIGHYSLDKSQPLVTIGYTGQPIRKECIYSTATLPLPHSCMSDVNVYSNLAPESAPFENAPALNAHLPASEPQILQPSVQHHCSCTAAPNSEQCVHTAHLPAV